MATLIASPSQIAEKSILDLSGRQIYLGNGFSIGTTSAAPGVVTEVPWVLIQNPPGSGKSMFVYNRRHSVLTITTSIVLFKYYSSPTITSNGTPLPIRNNRINQNSPLSSMIAFQQPTVTSNGTEILGSAITAGNGNPYDNNILVIIDPGVTILITTAVSTGGTPVIFQAQWYEIAYPKQT